MDTSEGQLRCAVTVLRRALMKNTKVRADTEAPAQWHGAYFVRPLRAPDVRVLADTVGSVVDQLYPNGRAKLLGRLEAAACTRSGAYVAASVRTPHVPIALASEAPKGSKQIKLCTFWVHPSARARGVGTMLLEHRVQKWMRSNIEVTHVTVRRDRAAQLMPLFSRLGFRELCVDIDRYGSGNDETVLQWRPDHILPSGTVGVVSEPITLAV
ncbi:MAG: N-acetyltransferase [Pseudonocardiales bacterium]|nr:N-acetyltransferase [Pseudonocardiales bacterium]